VLTEQRRGQLLTLAKTRMLPLGILTLLVTGLLATLGRVATRIIGHRVDLAVGEVVGYLTALWHSPRVLARGLRASLRSPVPRRRLSPLNVPVGEATQDWWAAAWVTLFADDDRTRRIRRTTWGVAGTTHGSADADFGRHGVWTVVVGLVSLGLGLLSLRSLLGRGTLDGPLLQALPTSWQDALQAAWRDWVPSGLGSLGPADPLVRLVGSVPLPAGTATVLLVLSIPLAALGAWWAAGALTRAVGARLALAVGWAAGPPLLAALVDGAWPLVLVHLLLPVLALAIGRAVGLVHKVSQASVSAAGAAGLLLLVIGAVQPVLVLFLAIALAIIAPLVPGRRWRLLWVLVPSLALHLPYLPQYVAHPTILLHVGGVDAPAAGPDAWQLLALWPTPPPAWGPVSAFLGDGGAALLVLLLVLPFALAAVVSPLLSSAAGTVGRVAVVLAAIALGGGAAVRSFPTELVDAEIRSAPLHALLSVALLTLLIGAGAGFDALARRPENVTAGHQALRVSSGVLVAAVCAVTVAGWTFALPGSLNVHRSNDVVVPQAARDLGTSTNRGRVLILEDRANAAAADDTDDSEDLATGDLAVDARLYVGGGPNLLQSNGPTGARLLDADQVDADAGSSSLRTATADVLTGGDETSTAALATLAIGYVVVPGPAADSQDLVDALDRSPLVEKVTQNQTGGLWRVVDSGPRVSVRTTETELADAQPVPSSLIDASGTVEPSSKDRVVVLAERGSEGWEARIGREVLKPVTVDGWAQGFTLPAGRSGELTVTRADPWRLPAQAALGAACVVTLLVSLPWRSRSRARGERLAVRPERIDGPDRPLVLPTTAARDRVPHPAVRRRGRGGPRAWTHHGVDPAGTAGNHPGPRVPELPRSADRSRFARHHRGRRRTGLRRPRHQRRGDLLRRGPRLLAPVRSGLGERDHPGRGGEDPGSGSADPGRRGQDRDRRGGFPGPRRVGAARPGAVRCRAGRGRCPGRRVRTRAGYGPGEHHHQR
jgi:hypothetical protein